MKIGYFGSPALSAHLLKALLESREHTVDFVVSSTDSPRGRSGKTQPTEVSELALERGLTLYRFATLKSEASADLLRAHEVDLYLVFAYGKLIPARIFSIPPRATINLHGSLLPLLRGASPIESALLQGHTRTGWTVQFITEEMDAGDIIGSCELSVDPNETAGELSGRMIYPGIELMLKVLRQISEQRIERKPQDPRQATHCSRIRPEMAWIEWRRPTVEIHNLVRAFNPRPVARSTLDGRLMHIHRTAPFHTPPQEIGMAGIENQLKERPPGALLAVKQGKGRRLLVKTGDGILEITEIQPENRKIMKSNDFLNGYRLTAESAFVRTDEQRP